MTKSVLPILPLIILAACNSATQDTSFSTNPPPEGTALTDLYDLPFSGSAQYDGRLGVGTDDPETIGDARLVGDLSLTADFFRDTVNGRADDFTDRLTGERLRGTLDVETAFDRDADLDRFYGASGGATGTLERPNGSDVDVVLRLNGDFYGRTGSIFAGDVDGVVDGLPLTPSDDVSGVFEATR